MREIYLIRHGMPDFPGGARMCLGRTDLPLGLRGRLQAALLGAEFAPRGITECFCSALSRSRQTAELMGFASPVIVPGLEEMDAGDWDGLSFDEIRRRWPEYYERRGRDRSLPPPGGEEFGHAQARFSAAVARAMALSRGDVVAVSHSSVIQTLLCTLEGRPFDCARDFNLPYGSVTRLSSDGPGQLRLEEYGRLPVPELTPELADRLLAAAELPEPLEAHCRATAEAAMEIVCALAAAGVCLDETPVYAAAELPEPLEAHCRATAEAAMEIVCALAAAGVCLDETPVYAAALLHDVSKGTPDHALAGAGLMSQLGYPVLAPLIAQHHDIEDPARVDEALVVYMADKLCRGDRRVSVSGRFRASFDKCRDAEALAAHDRRYKAALTAAHTINDICGKEVIPI